MLDYGIPSSIYTDRHTIFLSTKSSRISIEEKIAGNLPNDTQFGRAMSELGINTISAKSPQAKGRIERLWATLQSRIPTEFKLANIKTIDQANSFLKSYMTEYNERFSVKPLETSSVFRCIPSYLDVSDILCVKLKRTVDNDGTFYVYNKTFKIAKAPCVIPPRAKIDVLLDFEFGIKAKYKDHTLEIEPYTKEEKIYIPNPPTIVKKVSFEDDDNEVSYACKNSGDIFTSY